jgi:hypothetical protein
MNANAGAAISDSRKSSRSKWKQRFLATMGDFEIVEAAPVQGLDARARLVELMRERA